MLNDVAVEANKNHFPYILIDKFIIFFLKDIDGHFTAKDPNITNILVIITPLLFLEMVLYGFWSL